jgi:uncharacterized protein YbjT (DUF2867 family)
VRILLLGAYGFIGSEIARELVVQGHQVAGLGRDCDYGRRILPQLDWIEIDLARMTAAESWQPLLDRRDVVINASGLLQSGEGGSVETVQLGAVRALLKACQTASTKRFIQISAAGARTDANSDFMETKACADELIEASSISSLIIRPGLVIGRNSFGGTELVRITAVAPISLEFPFRTPIQCIALSDLVEAVAKNIELNDARTGCFDLVERKQRSLEEIIAAHRNWLGVAQPRWSIGLPGWSLKMISSTADIFGRLGWRSPLRSNAIRALEAGVVGDSQQARELLEREPLSLEATLAGQPAGKQDRLHARLGLVQPPIIGSLFIMWAASGLATLFQLDQAASILQNGGLGKEAAYAIAVGGGWVDVLLAAGLLLRWTVRPTLIVMIMITLLIYLVGGTMLLPGLWVDPLAPFAKALPATMLALVAFWMVEKR